MEEKLNNGTAAPAATATDALPNGGAPTPPAEPVATAAPPAPPAPLTAEEIEGLRQKAAKAEEHWDRLLRLSAEFDNYRKRAARERQEAVKFANETLLEKLVPVLDHFEMAMAAVSAPASGSAPSLQAGVAMIQQQLKGVLAEVGLEEIDAAGKPFDPNWHEAVGQQEGGDAPEGQVLQQLRKGYRLKDRLLRPATVIVAKKT